MFFMNRGTLSLRADEIRAVGIGELLARIERLRRLANDRMAKLIGGAKAAGQLRQEFASEDLLLLLVAHAAVVHVTREDAPAAGRRFVALMLDAFGPRDGPSSLPMPPSRTQMRRAMVRLAGERGCGTHG